MSDRFASIRRRLSESEAEAMLLSSVSDIRWACGFTGSNALLLVASETAHFVTDGRYTDQARAEVRGAEVHIADNGLFSCLGANDLLAPYTAVVFQSDAVSVHAQASWTEAHPSLEWMPVPQLLSRAVAEKREKEVKKIRAAQSVTESVFEDILDLLAPGMTEREVAAEIVYRHLRRGADAMSFDPIVASGPNAARPHARPTDRCLREGEPVVIDMGGLVEGYASDMTRTVALGDPGVAVRRAYGAVLDAQRKALDAARAGMTGAELDAVARASLEEADLGEWFSHGLGHGIGLQVHEWPRVSSSSDAELPVGACVTIEPGVYVPEEEYGIRIEDIVWLQADGAENLTRAPKEFLIL
jgi:Xaa-Pro aminopeptidase